MKKPVLAAVFALLLSFLVVPQATAVGHSVTVAADPSLPGEPISFNIKKSGKFSWGAPFEGAAVTYYLVTRKVAGGKFEPPVQVAGLEYKFGKFKPGVKYVVKATAVNDVGAGPAHTFAFSFKK